jgi:hypothetical protein
MENTPYNETNKGAIVEAEVEEIIEISERLSTEIQRRRSLIDFGRSRFNRKHDGICQVELGVAEKEVDALQELVNRALVHCMITSQ